MALNQKIRHIPIPQRLQHCRVSADGYPVPWFVPYIDGKPEFRAMDPEKFFVAIRHRRCFLCGEQMGKHLCFPIGPMCCITRTTPEPPSHLSCVEYAAQVCPFLTQPRMRRNEKNMPEGDVAGIAIRRNPGVIALWSTLNYRLFRDPINGGYLIEIGKPEHIELYSQGRKASNQEVIESIMTGMPILRAEALKDGPEAMAQLESQYNQTLDLLRLEPRKMQFNNHETRHE
jgi:hypothetical protein